MSKLKSLAFCVLAIFLVSINSIELLSDTNLRIDSLKQALVKSIKNDGNFPNVIFQIETYYKSTNPLAGIDYLLELLENRDIPKSDKVYTFLYSSLANLYFNIDRYEQSAKLYYLANNYAKKINDIGVVAWNTVYIGNLFFRFGNTEFAIKSYLEAIRIADSMLVILNSTKNKNQFLINAYEHIKVVSSENIGMSYQIKGQKDSAYKYLTKYSKIRLEYKNKINSLYYYNLLSDLFLATNKPDSVIKYSRLALLTDTKSFDFIADEPMYKSYINKTYVNLSLAFYIKKQYDSSKFYENFLLKEIQQKNNINMPNVGLLLSMIEFYKNINQHEKCINLINLGLKLDYPGIDLSTFKNKINLILADILDSRNDFKQASRIKSHLLKQFDSMLFEIRTQGMNLAEIDIKLQSNIDKVKQLEESNRINEIKLEAQKTTNLLYIFLIIAFGIILIGLIFTYINNKKHLNDISNKNNELNELNERLEESIKIKDEMNVELTASQHELRRINDNLEKANQTKNKLFSIIAHDMKNAIGGVRSLNQMLVDDFDRYDNDEKKEYIQLMNNSTNEMYKLLENLLLWSRSQRGQIQPNKENNYPYFMSNSNIVLYSRQIAEKNLKIINKIPKDFSFVFDANMLDTIFRNLLNNAIKFSNEGGEIQFSLEEKGKYVQFSIKDNGVGMSPEKAANIFSMSKTNTTVGTKGEKGTGLGLLVCYDFVQYHNGKIWFDSQIGKGTTVYFTFEYLKN